jgi:hypothetical protein
VSEKAIADIVDLRGCSWGEMIWGKCSNRQWKTKKISGNTQPGTASGLLFHVADVPSGHLS